MAAPQLNEQVRGRLMGLISEESSRAERLLARLREFRTLEGVAACSAALYLMSHLSLPEPQAERLLEELVEHRRKLGLALGRDPGLRVAALDYLSNVTRLLTSPTVVEHAELERTERSAITDPLTGLYNRRYFMHALGLELRRSRRYGLGMSLLMLDLDGFKALNDQHGHLFGDLVLARVGQTLRRAVREADRACRFGGEEFSVILPETERLGAYALGQRIRSKVEQAFARAPIRGERIDVRLSGGISAYPTDGMDAPTLVARADEALYRSKSEGRDRITLFHAERRGAIRYPARPTAWARIRLSGGGEGIRQAKALNFSAQGALLEIHEPCPPDARVEVSFGVPDTAEGSTAWTAAGRVVRVEHDPAADGPQRVAVAFEKPLPESCLAQQILQTPLPRATQEGHA